MLESNLNSLLITELGHFDIFCAKPVGGVRGPFNGDTIVEIGPGGMVVLGLAFICDEGHEAPGFGKRRKGKLTHDALPGAGELPVRKELQSSMGQVSGLVGREDYVMW